MNSEDIKNMGKKIIEQKKKEDEQKKKEDPNWTPPPSKSVDYYVPPPTWTPSVKTHYDQGRAVIQKNTIKKDSLALLQLNKPIQTYNEIVDQYDKPQPQILQTKQEKVISQWLETNTDYIKYNGGEIPGNSTIATINRDNTINENIHTQFFSTFSPYHMGNKIVAIKKPTGGKKRSQKRSQKRKRNKKSKLKSKRR